MLALDDTRIVGSPGETFHYNNYHPLLLGMILERVTGMSVTSFLQKNIWTPLGMEFGGSWSLDEHGFEKMESGINARAIDFAKFGRLFLHEGAWEGAQVISRDWVLESTQADSPDDYASYYGNYFIFKDGMGYYNYLWWGIQQGEGSYDFFALGNHGQFIYISPQADQIILRFGESYGEFGGVGEWVDMFYRFASSAGK